VCSESSKDEVYHIIVIIEIDVSSCLALLLKISEDDAQPIDHPCVILLLVENVKLDFVSF